MSVPDRGVGRPGWGELRRRLAGLGFRPSKRLGQNFLLDDNLASALVRDAGVAPGDFVLEVGPGLGRLTAPLLEAGARVLAVEVDGRLHELLRERLGDDPALRLLHADVLAGKHQLEPEVVLSLPEAGAWHLVANLPYAVSAPLLVVLAALANPPASMSVLVQREVADRIRAEPGSSAWGPLSIRLQAGYRTRGGREVDSALFWPRPKVASAVVHLSRREDAPAPEELQRLSELVGGLFHRRRQGLGRVLGDLSRDRDGARALLAAQGIDPSARAETLPISALQRLADAPLWRDRGPSGKSGANKRRPGRWGRE